MKNLTPAAVDECKFIDITKKKGGYKEMNESRTLIPTDDAKDIIWYQRAYQCSAAYYDASIELGIQETARQEQEALLLGELSAEERSLVEARIRYLNFIQEMLDERKAELMKAQQDHIKKLFTKRQILFDDLSTAFKTLHDCLSGNCTAEEVRNLFKNLEEYKNEAEENLVKDAYSYVQAECIRVLTSKEAE